MRCKRLTILALWSIALPLSLARAEGPLDQIETIVVIYAENRSFDNLYGTFPGADGLANVSEDAAWQFDRDGSLLPVLPPIWNGLTAPGATPGVNEAQTINLPNKSFFIDDPKGFNTPLSVPTGDLVHRFYQNQMQIHGGKNDRFVAYGDSGALVMGQYDGSTLPLWSVARRYTLTDRFFMGAFGGSFLNHFMLICACAAFYPEADQSPAKDQIASVEDDGVSLKLAAESSPSALQGRPKFVSDGSLTPDFYAVNTMQPPYQPSLVKAADNPAYADPDSKSVLPPQNETTIGDLLSAKGISWAWYAGAFKAALKGKKLDFNPYFQTHHQPFNYFANFAPGTSARADHLLDGGVNGDEFIKDIDAGHLPQVAFYKPQGNLNEHPGYANVLSGDEHVADVIAHLEKSPQWAHMLVIVTYDENGGFWDHAPPPKGDRWGPGTRVPALIVSPFAKKNYIDHTLYDTTSILRLITRRFDLPRLRGLTERDAAMAANGEKLGDLTDALEIDAR